MKYEYVPTSNAQTASKTNEVSIFSNLQYSNFDRRSAFTIKKTHSWPHILIFTRRLILKSLRGGSPQKDLLTNRVLGVSPKNDLLTNRFVGVFTQGFVNKSLCERRPGLTSKCAISNCHYKTTSCNCKRVQKRPFMRGVHADPPGWPQARYDIQMYNSHLALQNGILQLQTCPKTTFS